MTHSVIIICKNEGRLLRQTVDSILSAACRGTYEILVVDDGSSDGCCDFLSAAVYKEIRLIKTDQNGVAASRNVGAANANGEYLLFCDAHIAPEDGWLDTMLAALQAFGAQAICPAIAAMPSPNPDFLKIAGADTVSWKGCGKQFLNLQTTGYLPVQPDIHNIPIMSGPCTMIEATTFRKMGGFSPHMHGYGWEEEELSFKLWTFGYRMVGVSNVTVQHLFRTTAPYRILQESFYKNLLVLGYCHYGQERLTDLLEELQEIPYISDLLKEIQNDPAIRQEKNFIQTTRKQNDDWFFKTVNNPIGK